jgi:hypothetical protein
MLSAARQLVSLTTQKPGSRPAERKRTALELLLLQVLARGGIRDLERVIQAVARRGLPMQQTHARRGYRAWQQELRSGVLEVRGHVMRGLRTILVSWRARPAPRHLTPAQERRHREQEAFYARYLAAGQRAYASPPKRISAVERCILLVGELEADVNNGGFAQYLDNKGRRRAGEALRALRRIGARATARLLEDALKPDLPEAARRRLDHRFYEGREDLARLAFREFLHAGSTCA